MERDVLEMKEAAAGYANHSDVPVGHRTRNQWGWLAWATTAHSRSLRSNTFPKIY